MAWDFTGTGADISIGVDSVGAFYLTGRGKQICKPSTGDIAVIAETQGIEPLWTINSAALSDFDMGIGPLDLQKYFNNQRGRTSAAIYFLKEKPPQISKIVANVVTLSDNIGHFFETAKLVIGRKDLIYILSIHFLGLRNEGTDSPAPSLAEFSHSDSFKRLQYFSDYVTFTVQAAA